MNGLVIIMIETVECYLIKDNCYLMLHRNKEENDMHKGKYIGIGGHIEPGETKEAACIREIKEETGLTISPETVEYQFSIPNVYRYSGTDIHTLDFFFVCHVDEDAVVKADDDAAELQWIPLNEVYVERFGLRSIRQAVHRFLAENC